MADLLDNFARNKGYVKPGAASFATPLDPGAEAGFRSWVRQNHVPFNPDAQGPNDYDMRGFYQALMAGDPRAKSAVDPNDQRMHYPDYWKTPYHQTFSNESQWATADAPSWNNQDQLVAKDGTVLFDDRASHPGMPEPQRPLANGDDAAGAYLDHRQQSEADDLIAEARARVHGAASLPAGAGAAATAPQAAPMQPGPVQPAAADQPAALASQDPAAMPETDVAPGAAAPDLAAPPSPTPAEAAQGNVHGVPGHSAAVGTVPSADMHPDINPGAVVKDVATGVIQAPRQIVGGIGDAVGSVMHATTDLAGWLDKVTKGTWVDSIKLPEEMRSELLATTGHMGDKLRSMPAGDGVTSNLVRGGARFVAGLVPAARLLRAAGAGNAAATILGSGISGVLTQDGTDPTLAEMMQASPHFKNVVTEFLSSKPGDNEAVARLKNGLEDLGFGVLTEGVAGGLRLMKGLREARPQEGAAAAPDAITVPPTTTRDYMLLGDPNRPLVDIQPKPSATPPVQKLGAGAQAVKLSDEQTAAAASGLTKDASTNRLAAALDAPTDFGNKQVYINFARIDTPADVKTVLGQMTEAFSDNIAKAQRGVRSNEATQQAADALGMTVEDVLSRRRGQGFNAEEAVAARNLLTVSGQKLLQAAQAAAAPGATAADQFVFRKMMATHYAIQAEVIGARTETARALQAWSIPTGGGQEQTRAIEQMLSGTGGSDVSQAMAKRLALLAQAGVDPATMNQAIRKGAFAKTMDAVKEIWINGLLSSPKTHIVNTASNTLVAMQQIVERGVAGKVARLTGSGGVADGEAGAMIYGLLTGVNDAWRMAGKALRTGDAGLGFMKQDMARVPAVSAQAFNLDEAGGIGRAVDLLGTVTRVPGRLLESQDAFFKSIGYRMELHAQAYRQAASEGLDGQAFGARVAAIVADPPENIRIAAADAALYNTFTNETGEFGKKLMQLRNGGGALNPLPFIMPFVRTPINIARYSFERTPLAPLVGQWRADIAAGGARRDLALARMATGSAAMAAAADLAMQGTVSGRGPADPTQRQALQRQGWQPYSVKVGDKWVSYSRTDPIGQTLGFAADLTEALKQGDVDPSDVENWNELAAGGIAAISQFTINKTYLSGLADFMNVMSDPKRFGPGYVNQWIASFVPFTSAANTAERAIDPTVRDVNSPMDAVMARIPFLSQRLTPRRDLWGAPVAPASGLGTAYDALSPVAVSPAKESPIDAEMLKQRVYQAELKKKTNFAGVDVDLKDWPQVYDAYVRLAGNELKHPAWNMGAKDFLDAVVAGKHPMSQVYKLMSDGPDGTKGNFIKDTIRDYRQQAQQAILADPKFAAFAQFINEQQAKKQQQQLQQVQP